MFVSQEDDASPEYSVRTAVFDILTVSRLLPSRSSPLILTTCQSFITTFTVPTVAALQESVRTIVAESDKARQAGDADWWRPLEGLLGVVGYQNEGILDCIEDEAAAGRSKPIDIEALLADVVPPLITLRGAFQLLLWAVEG